MKKDTRKKQKPAGKHIRQGMLVKVITGNEKGQIGKVMRRDGDRVVIQGINVRKKTVRRTQENPNGGIIDVEAPLHISNVMACTDQEQPVKLRVREPAKGEKELVYTDADGQVNVFRSLKTSKQGE